MKFYTFQVLQDQALITELCGEGENALSAFENQIACGAYIPIGTELEVIATGQEGIAFKFECFKTH